MTHIRSRTAEDLDRCVEILAVVHREWAYPINWPEDAVAWLTPPDQVGAWVAVRDERVVGHVALSAAPADAVTWLVERLFVDPLLARGGIGRALLEHVIAASARAGRQLALDVADDRGAAIDFYRANDWTETARSPISWGGERATELVRLRPPLAPVDPSPSRSTPRSAR